MPKIDTGKIYKVCNYDDPNTWVLIHVLGFGEQTKARTMKCHLLGGTSNSTSALSWSRGGGPDIHSHIEIVSLSWLEKRCFVEEVPYDNLPLFVNDNPTSHFERLLKNPPPKPSKSYFPLTGQRPLTP
jgi:hypothetical protein